MSSSSNDFPTPSEQADIVEFAFDLKSDVEVCVATRYTGRNDPAIGNAGAKAVERVCWEFFMAIQDGLELHIAEDGSANESYRSEIAKGLKILEDCIDETTIKDNLVASQLRNNILQLIKPKKELKTKDCTIRMMPKSALEKCFDEGSYAATWFSERTRSNKWAEDSKISSYPVEPSIYVAISHLPNSQKIQNIVGADCQPIVILMTARGSKQLSSMLSKWVKEENFWGDLSTRGQQGFAGERRLLASLKEEIKERRKEEDLQFSFSTETIDIQIFGTHFGDYTDAILSVLGKAGLRSADAGTLTLQMSMMASRSCPCRGYGTVVELISPYFRADLWDFVRTLRAEIRNRNQ